MKRTLQHMGLLLGVLTALGGVLRFVIKATQHALLLSSHYRTMLAISPILPYWLTALVGFVVAAALFFLVGIRLARRMEKRALLLSVCVLAGYSLLTAILYYYTLMRGMFEANAAIGYLEWPVNLFNQLHPLVYYSFVLLMPWGGTLTLSITLRVLSAVLPFSLLAFRLGLPREEQS